MSPRTIRSITGHDRIDGLVDPFVMLDHIGPDELDMAADSDTHVFHEAQLWVNLPSHHRHHRRPDQHARSHPTNNGGPDPDDRRGLERRRLRPPRQHRRGRARGRAVPLGSGADADILLITGKPIGEPITLGGPFVMNTAEEVNQAKADFAAGLFDNVTIAGAVD